MNLKIEDLPTPKNGAIFYEDDEMYACLANFPIVNGHSVVVWKNKINDINLLDRKDYDKLMEVTEIVRDALINVLEIDKVYLLYMDEIKHVHWHLIPRADREMGMKLLQHKPSELSDTSLAIKLSQYIQNNSKFKII